MELNEYRLEFDTYKVKNGLIKQTNHSNTSEEIQQLLQDRVGDILWIYIAPLLLIVGTVGNVLSVLVLLRKPMRASTTMFYLTCLSFGDLFTLYTGLLRYWIRKAFDTDVRNLSDLGCKIHTFLVYLSLDFTVWVLVSVTVDRCLSVSLPFRSKSICTLKRCKFVVVFILFILSLKNMHFLWNLEVLDLWERRCDGKTESARDFISYVWPWIDFSTFCLIPFAIMIGCNTKIIYEMVLSQRKLKAHRNSYGNDSSLTPTHAETPTTNELSDMGTVKSVRFKEEQKTVTNGGNLTIPQKRKQPRTLSTITVTLLTINCVFLVTTSPIQAFLIGEEYWFPDKTADEIAWHNFWWAIVNILQYSNNCVHFFLYCLTGPRFRYELKCMFKRNNRVEITADLVSGTEQ